MSDIHGYYAALGVSSSAPASEIKSAYRKLAKDYHPDSGFNRDGGATFRFITEAYAVLSDARARSNYDSLSGGSNKEKPADSSAPSRTQKATPDVQETRKSQRPNPIRCDVCQKFTAQPRRIAFWNVTSLLFYSNRSPVQKVYCADCAGKQQIKSTVWTGLVGWWGVPWGPIWSIGYGVKNALGGDRDRNADDALAWNNVLAFASRGDFKLAVGIANSLSNSTNADVALSANNLISAMRSQGADTHAQLNDVWRRSTLRSSLLLVGLFAAPAALAFTIVNFGDFSASPTPSYSSGGTGFDATSSDSLSGVTAKGADARDKAPQPLPKPAEACTAYPENGAILVDRRTALDKGHILSIDNGTDGDAVIKVRNAATGKTLVSFFVAKSASADLKEIPDGTYRIQYAIGQLGKSCERLAPGASANEFPEPETLATTVREDFDGTTTERGHLSYTLFSVPNGNVRPSSINSADFEAD